MGVRKRGLTRRHDYSRVHVNIGSMEFVILLKPINEMACGGIQQDTLNYRIITIKAIRIIGRAAIGPSRQTGMR